MLDKDIESLKMLARAHGSLEQMDYMDELIRRYYKYKAQNAVFRMQQQPTINVYYDKPDEAKEPVCEICGGNHC